MKSLFFLFLATSLLASPTFAANKSKKVSYSQAKKECLQEKPVLKGKALQRCIKQKQAK